MRCPRHFSFSAHLLTIALVPVFLSGAFAQTNDKPKLKNLKSSLSEIKWDPEKKAAAYYAVAGDY